MAYVITQSCCSDATCVSVCPVNCIHPAPGEPDFGTTDMLYVDSGVCIDCGACADACPVDAVRPAERLTGSESIFSALNDDYYARRGTRDVWATPDFPAALAEDSSRLRVAVVGTGPSASYAAQELLHRTGAEVTMLDRQAVPGGLVRGGVAPDHQSTKQVGDTFAALWRNPRLRLITHVDVGRDVTLADVLEHHHAVIYATGASTGRTLDVPGSELAGCTTASEMVRWYNADPPVPTAPPLDGRRAVVVGSGNVALDVARTLAGDPALLGTTDVAEHALEALLGSEVREVLVLARRGPEHAAFTAAELLGLASRADLDLVVADEPATRDALRRAQPGSKAGLLRDLPLVDPDVPAPDDRRRVVLVFGARVERLSGCGRVESATVDWVGRDRTVPTRLVVAAIGYQARPVDGLPFDPATGTVWHKGGAVVDEHGERVSGVYVTGWVKRGPTGGIGANRACALETVETLLGDVARGALDGRPRSARAFARLVRRRRPDHLELRDVLAIDHQERRRGRHLGRPRLKFATTEEQLTAARRT